MSRISIPLCVALLGTAFLAACDDGGQQAARAPIDPNADSAGHVAPSEATAAKNRAVYDELPFANEQDFEFATRGLIASDPDLDIVADPMGSIWRVKDYAFIKGDAPASVNPSLWRQAKLNNIHGLFEVMPGIYQIRGYDLANMSFIRGKTGWIVVDPLTSAETAAAGLAMVRKHLGDLPIVAVIFTHSHVDHFGGVLGLFDDGKIPEGLPIYAPEGFIEEAVSENVIAGAVMGRRASYMYGMQLERSARGHVGSGLGKHPARGNVGIAAPTVIIDHTIQAEMIDGIAFDFQFVPESEAPAELVFYLPEFQAFCGAEIVSRNMHNLYTLRGAKVRDALKWSAYLQETVDLFAGKTDVIFNSHHWPVFGKGAARDYLTKQRDTYKFIHDQTLRYAGQGYTPGEIAEMIELPPSLANSFANRGYYGTVRHNSRAVYQFYFGWYDGNPVNLNPLPPEQAATLYVEAIGGLEAVLDLAQAAYDKGEYRWSAELAHRAVFAAPDSAEAAALLAANFDQMGYQAESGPWRDVYLTGAYELRHGAKGEPIEATGGGLLDHISMGLIFDAMATRLKAEEAIGSDLRINFIFSDSGETYHLWIENAVLHNKPGYTDPDADVTITLTKKLWFGLLSGQAKVTELIGNDEFDVEGSMLKLGGFFTMIDQPDPAFAIVTP